MIRLCPQCNRQFTPHDFYKEESRGMEAERRAFGLQGVRFLYYHCPDCQGDDIFIDLHPLENEAAQALEKRRIDLEAAVRSVRSRDVAVVITTKPATFAHV